MNLNTRRKIHFIHLTSAPGGLEVLLPLIIRAIPERDFKAFVIRPPAADMPDVYENTNTTRQYGSLNNVIAAAKLFRYVRKNRNDIFHVYNTGPFFLLVMRIAGANRVIYSIHGTIYWKGKVQRFLLRSTWQIALSGRYMVTSNSNYSRNVFQMNVMKPGKEIEVIYNPVEIEDPAPGKVKRENSFLNVGYAGRLVPGKNLRMWLNVAQHLSSVFSNIRFILFGDGVLRDELFRHAAKLGIADRVSFRGYVRDIASAYHECDVMLYLSGRESFGNAVVESVLCGTPVIASDIPAYREILANWPYCLVADDDQRATNIAQKISDMEILRGYLPAMINEFRGRFSGAVHVSKISRIYESLSS